jgi:crossover junction endodeoxyribonuclease RuvC
MTLRLVLGIDPGQSGAIAALADGAFAGFIDMPLRARDAQGNRTGARKRKGRGVAGGGKQIDGYALTASIKALLGAHSGAYVLVVFEKVGAMPSQGSQSGFRFGQADGKVRGIIEAHGLPIIEVRPEHWKKDLGLTFPKDQEITQAEKKAAAMALARKTFPAAAELLARAKDDGRSESLLIAHWAELTEQVARAA